MIIGVPKEIKTREYRVGLVPGGVKLFTDHGHQVLLQKTAGLGSGIKDGEFTRMGAELCDTAAEVWERADMIIKVKEPIPPEYEKMRAGQIVYTYFHLAAVPELAAQLVERKVTAVAYETIELEDRSLPLLKPMSEIAGKMAVQVGAACLEKGRGGKGVLLGGVPGVRRGRVAIIGGGAVGTNAAKIAIGMGAQVSILDINVNRLTYLDDIFGNQITTIFSNVTNVEAAVAESDLVVGGVLITGASAPRLVTEQMLLTMEKGSVIVDVAIDQGGCCETSRPTTHDEPTYEVHDILHYCVTNMPGAVARTSTFALTNVTVGYGLRIADAGIERAMQQDAAIAKGVNSHQGKITHKAVADSLGLQYHPLL